MEETILNAARFTGKLIPILVCTVLFAFLLKQIWLIITVRKWKVLWGCAASLLALIALGYFITRSCPAEPMVPILEAFGIVAIFMYLDRIHAQFSQPVKELEEKSQQGIRLHPRLWSGALGMKFQADIAWLAKWGALWSLILNVATVCS